MNVDVLVETAVKSNDMTFTYHVKDEFLKNSIIGKRVTVPFGKRVIEGFVLKESEKSLENDKIKDIINVVDDEAVLNDELINLGKYMSEKYLCKLIASYQVMLPKALKAKVKINEKEKYLTYIKLNDKVLKYTPKSIKQTEIINYLKDNKDVLKSTIKSVSSLKALIDNSVVICYKKEVYRDVKTNLDDAKIALTKDQEKVKQTISDSLDKYKVFLLHGVTGSGKTEVYISVIKDAIKCGKTAIVLVPEISLTPQILARFKGVFGDDVAILHSALKDGERYDEYRRIRRGEVKVVIGARSAVFAPLKNLGIIIIDEEHSESYKQECNPRYTTLDIAMKRCQTFNCPLVLGSATPTVESYARSKKGYYELLELPNRINNKPLPKVSIVDMKDEMKKGNVIFSEILSSKIKERLEKKEQVMLLLNRRGYANYLSCPNCGFVYKCPSCDITLTYHKSSDMMRCHYCGFAAKKEDVCPSCHKSALRQIGTGTEKLEEALTNLFPSARVLRMDADTTSKKGSHFEIINNFNSGNYDILIGTQMISKGLNFPNVTLVGVINADSSLNIPNFRSSEATYDLLDQVIGRAGRRDKEGEAIIQTFNPNNYSIVFASKHDYEAFYDSEISIRKKLNYPPYCFLALVKITSKDYESGLLSAKKTANYLRSNLKATTVLGPSMANILRIKNTYNFEVILKYKKDDKLLNTLNNLLKIYEGNSKVKIELDFNPINF